MLDMTVLDDKSYGGLLDEAVHTLPSLTPEWTDHNAHDPGITFLELFTWLTEMQRYYIQQTTELHTLQYLKLLGVTPKNASPAKLLVVLRLQSGDVLLRGGARTDIGGIPYMLPEDVLLNGADLRVCLEVDGKSYEPSGLFPFGKTPRAGDSFFVHLPFPLTPFKTYRLYVHLAAQDGRVPMQDGWITQADLEVEVWGGMRWLSCRVLDGTYGFSQSGFIELEMPEYFMPFSKRFLMRFTLSRCDMDEAPMLLWMSFQAAVFVQQELLCPEDTEFLVRDDKKIELPLEGAYVSSISLTTLENGRRKKWRQTHNLCCSKPTDYHFELDEKESCLRFGDGIHGKNAPPLVMIHELYATGGQAGRVKENLEFTIADGDFEYPANNPFHAEGGFDSESVADALARLMRERSKVSRAVTRDDYIEIIRETPGLRLKSIHVYECEAGKVRICIKTHGERLTEQATRNIYRRLSTARLCCVETEVTGPVYWKARLIAIARVESWAAGKLEELRGKIVDIYKPYENQFGLAIALSEWRRAIMEIVYVRNVTDLLLQGSDGKVADAGTLLELPPDTLLKVTELIVEMTAK